MCFDGGALSKSFRIVICRDVRFDNVANIKPELVELLRCATNITKLTNCELEIYSWKDLISAALLRGIPKGIF
jgi:hypothetical protein